MFWYLDQESNLSWNTTTHTMNCFYDSIEVLHSRVSVCRGALV